MMQHQRGSLHDVVVHPTANSLSPVSGRAISFFARVLVIALILGIASGAVSGAAGSPPVRQALGPLIDVPCPYAVEVVAAFGTALECSVLTAPMVHGADDSPVSLSVARIRSNSETPVTTPLVMLLGGPGQEVESILPLFAIDGEQSYRPLLQRQDVILIDQRGVGYSKPSLACPFDAVGGVRVPVQRVEVKDILPAFAECAAGMHTSGINLEAFDSVQSAADVDLLRQALGFEQIDLLGTSYGTRLALTVVRDFPGTVRSAILESPEPLQANLVGGQIIAFDQALSSIVEQCEREEPCAARYPDLNGTFATAVDALNAEPLAVSVNNLATGAAEEVIVDGTIFTVMVYFATFSAPLVPLVPALIDGIRTGENVVLENIAPVTLDTSAGLSLGASYVINCNDELSFTNAEEVRNLVAAVGVRPQIADGSFAGAFQTFDICAEFSVLPAESFENQPVASDVPVLILGGAFDPITPPSYAELALETLPNGVSVTFANGSHAPLSTSGPCGFGIVSSFLDDPAAKVDASCASVSQVEFVILPE